MGERVELFEFSYYDLIRRRWMKARYRASCEEIAARYPQHRIEGEPEIREGEGGQFKPPEARGARG